MKDDSEFENEEGSHLSRKMVIVCHVVTLMAKVIIASWWVREVVCSPRNCSVGGVFGWTFQRTRIRV
jgi:hypothetical protein